MLAKDAPVPLDLRVWHQKQVTKVYTQTFAFTSLLGNQETFQRYVVVENAN